MFSPAWKQGVNANEYLSSSKEFNAKTYTIDATTVPVDADGNKVLQPGTVMAKITATNLVGPYEPNTANAAANEVQDIDLGSASAGSITITFDGETTASIAYNATAATVKTALEGLSNINAGDVDVTGGPFPAAMHITFMGQYVGTNVPQITATPTGLTGGVVTIATATAGAAASEGTDGATDGRQLLANIVGINDTFLTTELLDGNKEIAVVKTARVFKAKLIKINVAGAFAQGDPGSAVLAQMRTGDMDILAG